MYVCMHVCMNLCMYERINECTVRVSMYVCMYVYKRSTNLCIGSSVCVVEQQRPFQKKEPPRPILFGDQAAFLETQAATHFGMRW